MSSAAQRALDRLPAHKRELARLLTARAVGTAPDAAATPDGPVPRAGGGPVPATLTQARLWRYARSSDPAVGTGSHAIRLRGPLDAARLRDALTTVLRRHEALRTHLTERPDGSLMQVVAAEPELSLRELDLTGVVDQAAEVARQVTDSALTPLDLAAGQSSAFRLLRLADDHHVLVLAAHLAVFDGWSSGVFLADLAAAYRGVAATEQPTVQFPDFADWQHQWLLGPEGQREVAYWHKELAGLRPAEAASERFVRGHLPVGLDVQVTRPAFAASAAHGATPFMALLAALAVVLAHRTGNEDIVIGTPTAGRAAPGLETAIGQFTTVVPIRVDCSGGPSFAELLRRTRIAVARSLAHGSLPVDALFGAGGVPPYSVLFALHNYPSIPLDLPAIDVEQVPGPPARHLELYSPAPDATLACIGLVERDGRITGTAEFNRAMASPTDVRALMAGIEKVLYRAASLPSGAPVAL
ncbi:condensation domain-containing protein [Streptomyces sp. NPDC001339]|uniref:condensation domain-containing protein n=1 Tax=Streptomyces sp. NPDC001339 TaxID=3364563 RepID=UPI0036C9AF48